VTAGRSINHLELSQNAPGSHLELWWKVAIKWKPKPNV
jgi:hypothetical protein